MQIGDAVVSADGDFGTVDALVSTDGTAADLAIGVAWDMAVHKQTPSEALFGNLISFGIGFGIGRGISGVGQLAGRNADNANVRGGQRIDAGDIRRLESASTTGVSESGRIRTERPNGIDPGASLRHPRTWHADNSGGRSVQMPLFPLPIRKNEGLVGTYGSLEGRYGRHGDDLIAHHVPSNKFMELNSPEPYIFNTGVTIYVDAPRIGQGRHQETHTFGLNNLNDPYYSLTPRQALLHDVLELQSIYRAHGLYDGYMRRQLIQLIELNKTLYPQTFAK